MLDVLGPVLSIRKAGMRKRTYVILETAEVASGITLFQVRTVLDLTSKQTVAKRAVGGQEEVMTETGARTNIQQQQCRVLGKWKSLRRNMDELSRDGERV
jgi:hypothetical protein